MPNEEMMVSAIAPIEIDEIPQAAAAPSSQPEQPLADEDVHRLVDAENLALEGAFSASSS